MFAQFRVIAPLKCPKRFSAMFAGVPAALLVAMVSPYATMLVVAVSSPERAICQFRLSTIQPEYIA